MSRRIAFLMAFLVLTIIASPMKAQDQPFLKIGDHRFTLDEFQYIYEKNNSLSQNPISKEEYVDLFVNYKLKVIEAIAQGYDTVPQFQRELNYYRNELAKPYLTDKKATDAVVAEAYDRLSKEVNASHILVKMPQSPTPDDTLAAYNKIKELQLKITKGADFGEVAFQHSDCPSGKRAKGQLGYFSGFSMVYAFETAAYNTPVDHVSPIIRTPFGYHLIKVHDVRDNRGEMKVAHIMKAYPYNAPKQIQDQAKQKIDSIYQQLLTGLPFDSLANTLSDDKRTAGKGGELDWFGTGKMVPEFADEAFALEKNEQLSEPIQTPFGWHIIKRIDKREMASLEEMRAEIEQRISGDERAYAGKSATIKKLKSAYDYTIDEKANAQLVKTILSKKENQENLIKELENSDLTIATYANKKITPQQFSKYINKTHIQIASANDVLIHKTWDDFVAEELLAFEKSRLETKYPDFKHLMGEYHDGLLIFEISQKEIWNKASADSTGLKRFFESHQTDYTLPERFEGTLYFCQTKKQLKKLTKHLAASNTATDSLPSQLISGVKIEKGTFHKGQYPALDAQLWPGGADQKTSRNPNLLLIKGDKKDAAQQELSAIKGQVISDYQNHLEKVWIENLRKKYKPEINSFVLEQTKL